MYYHFTFEKYYEEMLADGFIKPGKHRNCLPYDEKLNIGSVGDDPDYSKYIYLAKDKKVLNSFIIELHECGPDFLNMELVLDKITDGEYSEKLDDLGDIVVLKIPEKLIDKKYIIDDFNVVSGCKSYAYPLNISMNGVEVLKRLGDYEII